MRRTILIAFILLLSSALYAQDLQKACDKFNDFNATVLKGNVKGEVAVKQFDTLIEAIVHFGIIRNQIDPEKQNWIFPLQGCNYQAIGGTKGNGYFDKGYHYLDGNKHAAHPAHDIFIRDKNQDGIDDKTNRPVDVLAVADGIVIACTNEWEPESNLRGGKFIWIYHPQSKIFTYYAHNRAIFVKSGDMVIQGKKVAEVGRTGLNAYPKRSPTHLHFSAFHLINGLPVPFNPYLQLTKAEIK